MRQHFLSLWWSSLLKLLKTTKEAAGKSNTNAASDLGVAVESLKLAFQGCLAQCLDQHFRNQGPQPRILMARGLKLLQTVLSCRQYLTNHFRKSILNLANKIKKEGILWFYRILNSPIQIVHYRYRCWTWLTKTIFISWQYKYKKLIKQPTGTTKDKEDGKLWHHLTNTLLEKERQPPLLVGRCLFSYRKAAIALREPLARFLDHRAAAGAPSGSNGRSTFTLPETSMPHWDCQQPPLQPWLHNRSIHKWAGHDFRQH